VPTGGGEGGEPTDPTVKEEVCYYSSELVAEPYTQMPQPPRPEKGKVNVEHYYQVPDPRPAKLK
jgi:hypothetical protein